KDDLRPLSRRRARCLRIAPALVADHDTECQISNMEYLTARSRCVGRVLARVELDLVLKAGDAAVGIDDERGEPRRPADDALGAKDHGDVRGTRRVANAEPRLLEPFLLGGALRRSGPGVAGDVTLGKADDRRAGCANGRDGALGEGDGFVAVLG